jgi:cystathionine beta-lyase/cystathionine gamma-synthase
VRALTGWLTPVAQTLRQADVLSVGLEHQQDIIADLTRALDDLA